ncbi:rhodanese-like domain-containing protein [Alteromonas sp. 5E99-2]|uniref:rhodanese-like domain-containing protein n=1 Tax=Alteromonas sp. 5E99-2 TaxID=2817683 RepID=UPI001A991CF9|nr:rhodanese-like domain-containing protein [Alteromonas sp. 5E99-2]MBO1254396.1 rhodanese-like domain-containing protein [Alteromonas sp. 5E99-2]
MFKWTFLVMNIALTLLTHSVQADELDDIHQSIEKKYTNVQHIDGQSLRELKQSDVLIFDVRKPKEFKVSHLANAIQVDPDISESDFMNLFASDLKDKTAVFYCSVGRRSSELITRLAHHEKTIKMVNLEGGIFKWTNKEMPVNGVGVHPYNWYWSRLIEDKEKIFYSPPVAK